VGRGGLAAVGSVPSPPGSSHLAPVPGSGRGSPPSPGSQTQCWVSLRCWDAVAVLAPHPADPLFDSFQGEAGDTSRTRKGFKALCTQCLASETPWTPQTPWGFLSAASLGGSSLPSHEQGRWWDVGAGGGCAGSISQAVGSGWQRILSSG